MGEIVILGSAFAVPDEQAENTHFLLKVSNKIFLIDCASNPLLHIPKSGVDVNSIDDIILTHFHPDHVSGLPLLLMGLWLMGRKNEMNLYGLAHTLDRVQTMMELYDYESWPNFYTINFHRVENKEKAMVYSDEYIRILASPVKHLIPTMGLRFELKDEVKTIAYSCDTEPCEAVVGLAKKCDLLLHEASGDSPGHTSAYEAGEIAEKADAKTLYLIHYPTQRNRHEALLNQARSAFSGQVELAVDFMRISL